MDAQIHSREEALRMAQDEELDLVEVNSKGDVPICRILDYKKFLYEKNKKGRKLKSKQSKSQLKEIRVGMNISQHDLEFKRKKAEEFLSEGHKVKVYTLFRGRAMQFTDITYENYLKFALDLKEFGDAERVPYIEGKRMIMILLPKKKK